MGPGMHQVGQLNPKHLRMFGRRQSGRVLPAGLAVCHREASQVGLCGYWLFTGPHGLPCREKLGCIANNLMTECMGVPMRCMDG